MPDPCALLVLGFGASLLAAAVQGATGFGAGLILMTLLPFLHGVHDASIVVALLMPVPQIAIYIRARSRPPANAAPLALGMLAGVVLGTAAYAVASEAILRLVIGTAVAASCLALLAIHPRPTLRPHRGPLLGVGLASGLLTGAANIGGPPAVLYLYHLDVPRDALMATMQYAFLVAALAKIAFLSANGGMIRGEHLLVAALYAMATPTGAVLGLAWFRRIDPQRLRYAVYVGLTGAGGWLAISAVAQVLVS